MRRVNVVGYLVLILLFVGSVAVAAGVVRLTDLGRQSAPTIVVDEEEKVVTGTTYLPTPNATDLSVVQTAESMPAFQTFVALQDRCIDDDDNACAAVQATVQASAR
jgi:hypothetical protein